MLGVEWIERIMALHYLHSVGSYIDSDTLLVTPALLKAKDYEWGNFFLHECSDEWYQSLNKPDREKVNSIGSLEFVKRMGKNVR